MNAFEKLLKKYDTMKTANEKEKAELAAKIEELKQSIEETKQAMNKAVSEDDQDAFKAATERLNFFETALTAREAQTIPTALMSKEEYSEDCATVEKSYNTEMERIIAKVDAIIAELAKVNEEYDEITTQADKCLNCAQFEIMGEEYDKNTMKSADNEILKGTIDALLRRWNQYKNQD